MDATDFLKKRIKFYLGSVLVLYIALGLAVLMYVTTQIPGMSVLVSGPVFQVAYAALLFLALPLTIFAIVLLVFALQIIARTAKIFVEFKKMGRFGGLAAAAYLPLSIALLTFVSIFYPSISGLLPHEFTIWIWLVLNPITLGVALLVFHTIVIRQARALILASSPAPTA